MNENNCNNLPKETQDKLKVLGLDGCSLNTLESLKKDGTLNEDLKNIYSLLNQGNYEEFYNNFYKVKDKDYALDLLKTVALKSKELFFIHLDKYKDLPGMKDFINLVIYDNGGSIFNIVMRDKDGKVQCRGNRFDLALKYIDKYKDMPWAKDVLLCVFKSTSYFLLEFIKNKDEVFVKEVLISLTEVKPYLLFDNFLIYKDMPWAKDVLNHAADSIVNGGKPDYLKIAYYINLFHNESDEIRYLIIDKMSPLDLYYLITKGREEVFTSTYNGIIERFLVKLSAVNKDVYDLVEGRDFEGINIFLEAATSYGKIEEIFSTLKSPQRVKLLVSKIIDAIDGYHVIRNSVALIEMIEKIKDRDLLIYIGGVLKKEYQKGQQNQHALGIIGKRFADKFEDSFFKDLPDNYSIGKIDGISSKDLFDDKGRNFQQYFFYNDDDGKESFKSFLGKYKNVGNWTIKDNETFVKITGKKGDKQIIIYANKPQFDGETNLKNGFADIKEELSTMNPPLKSIVSVHRGHSYHATKTIQNLSPISKMVFLGSCGGFQLIGDTLDKSPSAQIISTKGIGTMLVNDPLFKLINEKILNGNDIKWEEIRNEIGKNLANNKKFKDYVRPDQNMGLLFYRKYVEFLEDKNLVEDNLQE